MKHLVKKVDLYDKGRPFRFISLCGLTIYEDKAISANRAKYETICKKCGALNDKKKD